MMETLLSYGEDTKRTQLTSGLFYKDRAGRMDSVDLADDTANDGLLKRRALGLESRTFDMVGRLHADIFFQDRYMINEVGVKIKLTRSKDDFCLTGAMVGKVQIVQASMFVLKVKLMPSVRPRRRRISSTNCVEFVWRRSCRVTSHAAVEFFPRRRRRNLAPVFRRDHSIKAVSTLM